MHVLSHSENCCASPPCSIVLAKALVRYDGALVVISHDRPFASALSTTHVAYVNEGRVTVEERPLRDGDWRDDAATGADDAHAEGGGGSKGSSAGGAADAVDDRAMAEMRQVLLLSLSGLPITEL